MVLPVLPCSDIKHTMFYSSHLSITAIYLEKKHSLNLAFLP